jgi:uncharacterized protein YbcC (UPF0753/DUF2309 family)
MSTSQATLDLTAVPPADEASPISNQLERTLAEVSEVIAPVWPLRDYVAVNPYAGIADKTFVDAGEFMRLFSDCETLMPLAYYAGEYRDGRLGPSDIERALEELAASGVELALTAAQIVQNLGVLASQGQSTDLNSETVKHPRSIRTIAEHATKSRGINWTEAIVEEVSKHCAAHFDQGQATWPSAHANLPLYQAWRLAAAHDLNIEILGLSGFRKYVDGLPYTPEAAIAQTLQQLRVPQRLWSQFLLCQAFSVRGWSAWMKYQSNWRDAASADKNDLVGLLAIRLAYDAALAQAQAVRIDWQSLLEDETYLIDGGSGAPQGDTSLRHVLLRASEIAYRDNLLKSLAMTAITPPTQASQRKLAQMVFCIDVRSERIRRQLESQSSDIETFGFAGFFGMAFEFAKLGQTTGTAQLPVLLKPQFKIREGLHPESESPQETVTITKRRQIRSWRAFWKSFKGSAVSCFSFVETVGLFFAIPLLRRAIGYHPQPTTPQHDGVPTSSLPELGPTLRGLCQQGLTPSLQTDLAERMLRNLGLTQDFAQLVVFCGHASQTENNPLAASLDCGACGGHSGEPNARFAALLLNQPHIRQALAERGIAIPADTHFLGGLHNTTTDRIDFYDVADVPAELQAAVQELQASCAIAGNRTQLERLPIVASNSLAGLLKRSQDWSEVRPEWGLAGNAAFIVAPRAMTRDAHLDARSFLHNYDYTQDTHGQVLETIMTAPMIVANWINLQYYASTVDNRNFGSGNKTIHNVVGGFGILSGNGGDLTTGLPWQSLHTGHHYQHLPMRLQVVIAAPREMIERVIAKHKLVSNLLNGNWLHIIAINGQRPYRYLPGGGWEDLGQKHD